MHHITFEPERDMNEFIFGHLATPQQRMEFVRQRQTGVKHNCQIEPRAPRAADAPLLTATVGLTVSIGKVECHILEPRPHIIPLAVSKTQWDPLNWRYMQYWEATLPPQPEGTTVRYQIWAYPANEVEPIPADGGATFSYWVGNPSPPDWVASAVLYQLFPDRFDAGNGRPFHPTTSLNDIFGGTLRGIIDRLDYIAAMGFTCIWLNPFFPDDTHHGYHAYDYFGVNPRLGTAEELRELLDKGHALGLRFVLDFVANHWGHKHATFQHALAHANSPYHDWYNWIDWPHDYHTFFGVMELPQINTNQPEARAHLISAALHWCEFGFDGLRLDYALGPSHDFWTAFRAAVKQDHPHVWLFGEAVSTPGAILSYRGRFDGCLDFILLQALRDTFAFGTMDVCRFESFLRQHEAYFPTDYCLPSFLDNHDMNRFLWLTKGDVRRLKLAALCQFTLAGPPVVYYGTEVGVTQERDVVYPDGRHIMEESRQPMLWGEAQNEELREFYRWLIGFRRAHPVLWEGERTAVHLHAPTQTYAYLRHNEQEQIVVAFNLSEEEQVFTAVGQTFHLAPLTGEVRVVGGE